MYVTQGLASSSFTMFSRCGYKPSQLSYLGCSNITPVSVICSHGAHEFGPAIFLGADFDVVPDSYIGTVSSSMFAGMMIGAVGWGTCELHRCSYFI